MLNPAPHQTVSRQIIAALESSLSSTRIVIPELQHDQRLIQGVNQFFSRYAYCANERVIKDIANYLCREMQEHIQHCLPKVIAPLNALIEILTADKSRKGRHSTAQDFAECDFSIDLGISSRYPDS